MLRFIGRKSRPLVFCSNLHVGGGVQVAASFLSDCFKKNVFCDIYCSSLVSQNFSDVRSGFRGDYSVYNSFGLRSLFDFRIVFLHLSYDRVFHIFGPVYSLVKPKVLIVGFAQPWIIYPNNEIYNLLPLRSRVWARIKFFIQALFFSRADVLIVESPHVGYLLSKFYLFRNKRIVTIPNKLSSVFVDSADSLPPLVHSFVRKFTIGYVGRDYIHKNLSIFPEIAKILKVQFGVYVVFAVTLTTEEWYQRSLSFRSVCINHGPLKSQDCPLFYQSVDACIFPSLLECFSIMPIEAMFMKKPVFASDRDFVRAICKEFPFYFDPLSPADVAEKIYSYLTSDCDYSERLERASNFVRRRYGRSSNRTDSYIKLLNGE